MYILLKKAEYLAIDLILTPRGSTVPSQDYVIVTSATLRDYIDAQTITVDEDIIAGEVDDSTGEEIVDGNNADNANQQVVE